MANKKISALTAATVVNDTDLIPIVQAGVNKKATRLLVKGAAVATPTLDEVLISGATFTDDREIDLDGNSLHIIGGNVSIGDSPPHSTHLFEVNNGSPEPTDADYYIVADPTQGWTYMAMKNGNYFTSIQAEAGVDELSDTRFNFVSTNGVNVVQILGDPITNNITHTAGTHTFIGDLISSGLAGGGTTGLSIDNDGKIIRTP